MAQKLWPPTYTARMLAAVCAFVFAEAYKDSTISFHGPAMRVGPLLGALSSASGTKMKASTELDRLVALVDVDSVAAPALREELADALDARWKQEGDTFILIPSPMKERAEEQQNYAIRLKIVNETLAMAGKGLADKFDGQSAANLAQRLVTLRGQINSNPGDQNLRQEYEAANRQGPTRRVLLRLLQTLPREDLAQLDQGDHIVYAFKPTRLQRSFSGKAVELFTDFFREQELFAKALSTLNVPDPTDGQMVNEPLAWREGFDAEPSGFYLSAGFAYNEALLCNLCHQSDGFPTTIAQFFQRGPSDDAIYRIASDPNPKKEEPIELSEDSKAFLEFSRATFPGATKPREEVSPALAKKLADPARYDPLSLLATDALRAIAKERHQNLVAWVPDSMFMLPLFPAMSRPLSLSTIKTLVTSSSMGLDSTTEGGWLLMKPKNPYRARKAADDRNAMARIAKAALAGHISLDDYANYAASCNHGPYDGLGTSYAFLIDPAFGSMSDGTDWDALRLFGSFDPMARTNLAKGEGIAFRALSDRQKNIVRKITFARLIQSDEANPSGAIGKQVEPSEILQAWVPDNGILSIQVNRSQAIYAYLRSDKGSMKPFRTIDPSTIAWTLYAKEHPSQERVPAAADGYALGEKTLYRMRLAYGPKLRSEFNLTDNGLPTGSPVPWTQLPQEIRSKIEAALKLRADQAESRLKQTNPPPSR